MRVLKALGVSACLFIGACGKEVLPVQVQEVKILSTFEVSEGLVASRLVSAGCIQVVQKTEGVFAQFTSEECPKDTLLLPPQAVVFSLQMEILEGETVSPLRKDGVLVGEAKRLNNEKKTWAIRHLCQISDLHETPAPYFREVCTVEFNTGWETKRGRYASLKVVRLEDLARRKVLELETLRGRETIALQQAAQADLLQNTRRREREQAERELRDSRELLLEAQRGVRDSLASNLAVHRSLERSRAEAELKFAQREVQHQDLEVRFAQLEARRAQLLKDRMEEANRAKNREPELKKQLEELAGQLGEDNPSVKQLKGIVEQNRQLILGEEQRKSLEEEINYALLEAQKLEDSKKKYTDASNAVIEKKRQLVQIDRLPKITVPDGETVPSP
jgi:hypothetical protein